MLFWAVALTVISSAMGGWALSTLWDWFIVPVFGVPVLSVVQAIGISLVVNYFLSGLKREENGEDESPTTKMIVLSAKAVFFPVLYVAVGWIVLQFMA